MSTGKKNIKSGNLVSPGKADNNNKKPTAYMAIKIQLNELIEENKELKKKVMELENRPLTPVQKSAIADLPKDAFVTKTKTKGLSIKEKQKMIFEEGFYDDSTFEPSPKVDLPEPRRIGNCIIYD